MIESTNDKILLHLAVIEGNYDVVKFFLKRNVQVNARAVNKDLSVEFKTDLEHKCQVDYLKENTGTQVDMASFKTCTALHLAVRRKDEAIAELLLRSGAEVDARMEGGETPLIIAALEGSVGVVKLLLENGANVVYKTHWGKTALHYAAQIGDKSMVELLLKHEANVNAINKEGMAPLHIAIEIGQREVVALLLKNGAEVNAKNRKGATPVHFAAVNGHADILELLVNAGADINSICKRGKLDLSPFEWISPDEEAEIMELVSKYTSKNSIINWYNSVMHKLVYKKSKDRKNQQQNTAI